uniref:Mos1 transposase HTH domain-containing protein n=1 Tax=Ditylenchus dipsaci TaxID=166011 RepID=A0A915EEK7_9BILA
MSDEVPIKLRYFMLNHFEKGWTPEQSFADLTETYGEDVISKDSVNQWFSRFQSGDKNVEDEQESMLADVTGTSQATINRNLKQFETKQPNLPKRAMSAFFIWMQENVSA